MSARIVFDRLPTIPHSFIVALPLLASAACDPGAGRDSGDVIDLGSMIAGGKADLGANAQVNEVAPETIVEGEFSGRSTIYGYVLDLGEGAEVTAKVGLTSRNGVTLDTIMSINADYESRTQPGALLDASGNGEVTFEADHAGRYLVAFTSFDDADAGNFRVDLTCEGTDEACSRGPATDCQAGSLVLQGGEVTGTQTWSACDVTLIEDLNIIGEVTVDPGVTISAAPGAELLVSGEIAILGSEEAPVRLQGVDGGNWQGLRITNDGSLIQHAIFSDSLTPLRIGFNSSGTVTDTIVERHATPKQGIGIRIDSGADFQFVRALVRGFQTGMRIDNANDVRIEDSVLRDNRVGMEVTGGSLNGNGTCGGFGGGSGAARDPIIVHTDIIHNDQQGIVLQGNGVLLQVDKSNLMHNKGLAIEARGRALVADSHVRDTNLAFNANATGAQVRSFHRETSNGLELGNNYYGELNDLGELSQRFTAVCGGFFDINGFSIQRHADAGPRLELLTEEIRDECAAAAE